MFYSGLFINDEINVLSIVIIEKELKSARRLYRVSHIAETTFNGRDDLPLNYLEKIREESAFITRKKVFSQDMKPPKITRTPPVFLMAEKAGTGEYLKTLRNSRLTVEGLIFEENRKWRYEEALPLRYGSNYYVNPSDISKTLLNVCNGGRLLFNDIDGPVTEFRKNLQQFQDTGVNSGMISALSVAVWFCEKVRQTKRY